MKLQKAEYADFIHANTSVMAPPHVPEIKLNLADEAHDLWLKTEEKLALIGLPPPFWAFAWAGGQGIARYILDNPDVVKDKVIVDFATGSGLVAIAAKQAGASNVIACDIDPFCQTAVMLNAALNNVDISFTNEDLIGRALENIDVLLAGDVFYDKAMANLILPWFQQLSQNGTKILIGDPGRSYLPMAHLTEQMRYQVPVTRALEDAEIKQTIVWKLNASASQ